MTFWTEDRVATLKSLWADGRTASQIAHALRHPSRSAIIGKVHRLMLPARAVKQVRSTKWKLSPDHTPVKGSVRRPGPPLDPAPLPPIHVDDVARVSFAQLDTHHCRWPVGDPTAGFCGLNKSPGQSYCPGHVARATASPVTPSEREQWRNARFMGTVHPISRQKTIHAVDTRELEPIP